MEYTQDQIKSMLTSGTAFPVTFAIDNNFSGVQGAVYKNFGFSTANPEQMRNFILSKLKEPSASAKMISTIQGVAYLNGSGAPYTMGFKSFFDSFIPKASQPTTKVFSLDSLFLGLGAGLTAFASANNAADSMASGGATGFGTGLTQAEIDAAAKAEQERIAAEQEAAKRKKTITIIIVVAVVLVVVGLLFYFLRKK